MGWTPAEVRSCSLADFVAAVDGYLRSKGIESGGGSDALTAEDVRELLALLED